MTSSNGDLLDVNVWLALSAEGHAHHEAAQTWVAGRESHPLIFCRITQMALLRHLTTAAIMGSHVCTQKTAWRIYDSALTRRGTHFLSEPPALEKIWRDQTASEQAAAKTWTDAYLAAFARGHGLRLVTFDRAMRKYEGTDVLALES